MHRRLLAAISILSILWPPPPAAAAGSGGVAVARPAAAAPAKVMDRPPQAAARGCLSPAEVVAATGDRDIARRSAELADSVLCLGTVEVQGSSGAWRLVVVAHRSRRGPRWVVPHDDEQAGFDAGVEAVRRYGGTLVAVETGEKRTLRGVDPNRIFGTGTCRRGRADPPYTAAVLAGVDRRFPVVALHSNERRGGTISMSRPYAGATAVRAAPPPAGRPWRPVAGPPPRRDDDTMVVLAGRSAAGDPAARTAISWFTERGANVLYETVRADRTDCSLSNHVILAGLGRSYSVEVAHGDSASAHALVELVMEHAGIARE